jgi:hypothetical protein
MEEFYLLKKLWLVKGVGSSSMTQKQNVSLEDQKQYNIRIKDKTMLTCLVYITEIIYYEFVTLESMKHFPFWF